MSQLSFAQCQRLYESVLYQLALDKFEVAKTDTLALIKSLNGLLKQPVDDSIEDVKQLCSDSINLFQSIKSNTKLDINTKLKWIGSSLNGGLYPPIHHSKIYIDSEPFIDQLHLSPNQLEQLIEWKAIPTQNWSLDGINHIYQDFLQDCSFVASLISLSRNNSADLLQRIVPHNNNERFGVVLNFNGCERLVQIGNQLPELSSKSLYIRSRTNEDLYWPAFIEKAYLKILGHGYESIGSNSSIDTFMISGWIPEFISSIERPDMSLLWNEFAEGFKDNKIVLSLGTGDFTSEFHPNHDYAIVDMIEDSQSIILKNPWKRNISMIKFSEIFDNFETLYINWNPKVFQHHSSLNFIWNRDSILDNCLFNNPQFSVHNHEPKTTDVWILLEKHLGYEESSTNVIIYTSNGEKLSHRSKPILKSKANNTGFHLSKFRLTPNESATIVIFNNSKDQKLTNFTIHSYSNYDVAFQKALPRYKNIKWIDDEWSVDTCGGNWTNQSYLKNPQYKLTVPNHIKDVSVKAGLFALNDELINVSMYWNDSSKPFSNKPISSNQQTLYHPGSMVQDFTLKPGQDYKLVLSTYDSDVLTSFKMLINSEIPITIEKIATRLGLFVKPFRFKWQNKNRFKLKLIASRETELKIHIWSNVETASKYRPKIRASLFYSNGEPIQVNSEFDDNFYGIWLTPVNVTNKDEIILLIERFEIGTDEIFGEIGSTFKVEVTG